MLFPQLTGEKVEEPFLWEAGVNAVPALPTEEDEVNAHGVKTGGKVTVLSRLGSVNAVGGAVLTDESTRLRYTYTGEVTPLLTHDGAAVLARWKTPEAISSVVIFDGALMAGPSYTGALESAVLALDKARGTKVTRNPYWGHVVYEGTGYTIDVATSGYDALQEARPWQHHGIDIIYGEVNPLVKHGECTLILHDYVGPYAGGKGEWSVLARTELQEMTLLNAGSLRVRARGVTRVSHIGATPLHIKDAAGFEEVKDQLEVWKAMWAGKKAYSRNPIDGGQELHFTSAEPVVITCE